MTIPTMQPLTGVFIPVRYYIAPNELAYDIIIGKKDGHRLGYVTGLLSEDKSVFVHKKSEIYDIRKGTKLYEMMDYLEGEDIDEYAKVLQERDLKIRSYNIDPNKFGHYSLYKATNGTYQLCEILYAHKYVTKVQMTKSKHIIFVHNLFLHKFDIDLIDTPFMDVNSDSKYRNDLVAELGIPYDESNIVQQINKLEILRSTTLDKSVELKMLNKIMDNVNYIFVNTEIDAFDESIRGQEYTIDNLLDLPQFIDEKVCESVIEVLRDVFERKGIKIARAIFQTHEFIVKIAWNGLIDFAI